MYCTGFLRGVLPVHYGYILALVGRTLRREEGMLLLGCIVLGLDLVMMAWWMLFMAQEVVLKFIGHELLS